MATPGLRGGSTCEAMEPHRRSCSARVVWLLPHPIEPLAHSARIVRECNPLKGLHSVCKIQDSSSVLAPFICSQELSTSLRAVDLCTVEPFFAPLGVACCLAPKTKW